MSQLTVPHLGTLCLGRKLEESIIIANSILVKVGGFRYSPGGTKVRLVVQAMNTVQVDREEVWLEKLSHGAIDRNFVLDSVYNAAILNQSALKLKK